MWMIGKFWIIARGSNEYCSRYTFAFGYSGVFAINLNFERLGGNNNA